MKLLEVRYDDDGNRHYFSDGEEISETQWMQQHPHMRGQVNGGTGSQGSGRVGGSQSGVPATEPNPEEVRRGIRALREAQRQEGGTAEGQ